jgi:murein L,D-transpeptidase YcbB/YkuD
VAVLRARLVSEADLAPGDDSGDVYDAAAVQAVRRFQARHGLDPDGVLGAETLAALNVPVSKRIRQIELNLERWRWLPRSLGLRYVMVNSAAFTLEVVDSARQLMTMRAIVGRSDRPTPIVSGRITGVIFDPVWNVPRSIAVEEMLPLVRRNPRHLEQHAITVFEDSSRAALQVDPATIDWAAMTQESFNLQLRQAPGGDNPLGGVKVVFGSRFNVAIHDTPLRSLFRERVRTFSHGCIRVDRAADLVTYLLQDSVRWTGDSVRARMAITTEGAVTLPRSVPVHLSYWTALVDDDGTVQFRDDVYGWDARLADALASHRPRSP